MTGLLAGPRGRASPNSLGTLIRFTATFGAAAMLMTAPARAGDIDGASADETATLTGAPLLAALAPAEAVADQIETIEAPQVRRLSARFQCVPYAREQSGVDIRGDAVTWWRQAAGRYERTKSPELGAVIVMRGYHNANRGHVAVVRHVLSSRSIIIDHANWLASGEITLNVPVVDVSPKNDWTQVRVWHIPTHTWGQRIYTVQGFIVPGEAAPAGGAGAITAVR